MYDNKLVTAAQQGDEAAFAALYDRNVDGVYDLCFALVGSEREASRLTALVFKLAARHLADISDASQVSPWLLAITRDRVLAEEEAGTLESAWDTHPESPGSPGSRAAPPDPSALASDPDIEPLGTNDLRRWVRQADATLALADQIVVELGTRHDLDPDQLAAAVGCPQSRLDSIISQVEREAEQVLGSLVLARQGRKDCRRLAALLGPWDGHPAVEVADTADRHATACERCRRRRALVSPIELLAAAPAFVPPAELRTHVLELAAPELPRPNGTGAQPRAASPSPAAATAAAAAASAGIARPSPTLSTTVPPRAPGPPTVGTPPTAGTPPTPQPPIGGRPAAGDRPWGLIAAVGAAIVVLIVALVLVLRPSSSPTKLAATPPSSTPTLAPGTTTVTTVAVSTPPVTIIPIDTTTIVTTLPAAAGSQLALNTTSVDFGVDATSAQVVLSDTGAGQASWHASSPVPWLTITPPSGFLQSSGQVQVTFTINRHTAPNGPFHVTVKFAPADATGISASLSIVGTNTEPTTTTRGATSTTTSGPGPFISGVSASPAALETAPCPNDQSVISATVTSPSGVDTALVDYALPGGSHGTSTMTQSGTTWSAAIGGAAKAGTMTYEVRATGGDGNTSTSPPGTITVSTCPI